MSEVAAQYEAYPYPERDPRDERRRLVTGSPSHPLEIDHYLFAGKRDWSAPFRVLVAGGGTGDGLIQIAQVLASAGRAAEITYLDLSRAARAVAEARAEVRGLGGIRFETASLLDAADFGRFDYIDCCGVLHHLPEPQAGFDALAAALAPGGGLGLMVYAPHGRAGVYALQRAFGTLLQGAPETRLARARAILARLPEGHPFRRNPHLSDHEQSDAGFYDLLLHSQDRPFRIDALLETLGRAGLVLTGSPQAALYDLASLVGAEADPGALDPAARMALAEDLRGTIRTHVLYAARAGEADGRVARPGPALVPHLKGVSGRDAARAAARGGRLPVTLAGERFDVPVPPVAVQALAQVDGRRSLAEIAAAIGLDWLRFAGPWGQMARPLADTGVLTYSGLLRR